MVLQHRLCGAIHDRSYTDVHLRPHMEGLARHDAPGRHPRRGRDGHYGAVAPAYAHVLVKEPLQVYDRGTPNVMWQVWFIFLVYYNDILQVKTTTIRICK